MIKKDELIEKLQDLEKQIKLAETRLDALSKENAFLRELVHHLASRPAPYPPSMPTVAPNTVPWPTVEKLQWVVRHVVLVRMVEHMVMFVVGQIVLLG